MTVKPASVRFYVDADTLGLARILTRLRSDVTFPGDPGGVVHKRKRSPCIVADTSAKDADWIGPVASQGLLVLTRDQNIARRPREYELVRASRGRHIAIGSREPLDNWGILEVVMSQWRWIEKMLELPGPFIYSITRTNQRKLL